MLPLEVIALSVGGTLSFSAAAVLYRLAMRDSAISPLAANALRATLVLPLLAAAGFLAGSDYRKPPQFYFLAFLSTVFIFLAGDSLLLYGLRAAPVAVVYPVAYTYSLFTALFSNLILGERVKPLTLAAALLVIGGVFLAYRDGSGDPSGSTTRGVAAGLGASLSWGIGITLNKPALDYSSPLELAVVRLVMLLALSLPMLTRELRRVKAVNLKPLVLGGLLGVGAGPLLFLHAIEIAGVVEPSVISSSAPVLALVLGTLTLKEKPGVGAVLASVLVAAGVAALAVGG